LRLQVTFVCAVLGLLAGCLPTAPAHIIVDVFTDLQAPVQFDAIEVRVYGDLRDEPGGIVGVGRCGPLGPLRRNSQEYTLTFCREFSWDELELESDGTTRTVRLGVLPGSEEAAGERVGIEAVAYRGDVEVLRTFDHTTFPSEGPRTRRLFLGRACLETVCEAGLTCRRGGVCEEPELPDEPDAGAPPDGGVATEDVATPVMPAECVTDADCAPTSVGSWSNCDYASECDGNATRTRSVTTHPCEAGVCGTRTTTESDGCTRETNGDPCNGGSSTDLGTCEFAGGECDETGTQSVHAVLRTCVAGECLTEFHNGTQGCSRETDGQSCGIGDSLSQTSCGGFSTTDPCDRTGTYTVTLTERFCVAGSCGTDRSSWTVGCSRSTTGMRCGRATCADRCNATGLCVEACGPGCPC